MKNSFQDALNVNTSTRCIERKYHRYINAITIKIQYKKYYWFLKFCLLRIIKLQYTQRNILYIIHA